MNDPYNRTIVYLRNKYKRVRIEHTDEDVPYKDKRLILLTSQYYLGEAPKRELKQLVENENYLK